MPDELIRRSYIWDPETETFKPVPVKARHYTEICREEDLYRKQREREEMSELPGHYS